ncbi:MAG: sigma-70 family RNA polymerase sigma factor [Actinobacteria bacterium]|nr:sigma-70 family RNA polymerase sigma factor [Actinomycetota bacterium]
MQAATSTDLVGHPDIDTSVVRGLRVGIDECVIRNTLHWTYRREDLESGARLLSGESSRLPIALLSEIGAAHRKKEGIDANSFESFYACEFLTVFRASFAFCGDRELALDATQEAFARAFARWFRLHRQPWRTGWVVTTAINVCKRHKRRRRVVRAVSPAPGADISQSQNDVVEQFEVLSAIRQLSTRQRQAVSLYYLADQPVHTVADLMNLSPGAVKQHLSRAREHLKKYLEEGS